MCQRKARGHRIQRLRRRLGTGQPIARDAAHETADAEREHHAQTVREALLPHGADGDGRDALVLERGQVGGLGVREGQRRGGRYQAQEGEKGGCCCCC